MEIPTIAVGSVLALTAVGTLCYKIGSKNGNGKHSKSHGEIYKKVDTKVDRGVCHDAQKSIHNRIGDLDKHLSEKSDLIIELIKQNGKQ